MVTWPHLQYNLSHETIFSKYFNFKKAWSGKFCWNHQNCKACLFKHYLKTKKKTKESMKLRIKMESLSVLFDKVKFADFQWKNTDVSRTQEVRHVIHIFLASSLGITVPSFIIVGCTWHIFGCGELYSYRGVL